VVPERRGERLRAGEEDRQAVKLLAEADLPEPTPAFRARAWEAFQAALDRYLRARPSPGGLTQRPR